jgi:hypothetical protein
MGLYMGNNCEGFEVDSGSGLQVHLMRVNDLVLFLQIEGIVLAEMSCTHFTHVLPVVFLVISDDVSWVGILHKPSYYCKYYDM